METIRTGVYICWCGSNIARVVDTAEVVRYCSSLPDVAIARDYKYMCSDPGQDLIVHDIKELGLNRVVVAACSPRMHENTFRRALERAGLNGYLFEMANIREQDSWVHEDRNDATRKAKALVSAAIRRVHRHEPLARRSVPVHPATLVIGGGLTGMSAALELADAGRPAILVEKSGSLGGIAAQIRHSFPAMTDMQDYMKNLTSRVMSHPMITVALNASISDLHGYIGNFEAFVREGSGRRVPYSFGHILVATGLRTFDPARAPECGYGRLQGVVTSLEFEQMLARDSISLPGGTEPHNIVIIHCVGSRNSQHHPYCSRTCCQTALKYANSILDRLPSATVCECYADMRAMDKGGEELYASTAKRGVVFLMFDQHDGLPRIRKARPRDRCSVLIEMDEVLSGEAIELRADLVILMTGVEAQNDARDVAHAVGISADANGFFIEKHPKLDPVATTTDGVLIAGCCQGPKSMVDCVSQARAAAARILSVIMRGSVNVEVTTAFVHEEHCCGCHTCVKVCPYGAVGFCDGKPASSVNEVLCKGCGTCVATCPAGAITNRHFTDDQIMAQIEAILYFEHEAGS
jgi:heterodisulfide reductase subunit A